MAFSAHRSPRADLSPLFLSYIYLYTIRAYIRALVLGFLKWFGAVFFLRVYDSLVIERRESDFAILQPRRGRLRRELALAIVGVYRADCASPFVGRGTRRVCRVDSEVSFFFLFFFHDRAAFVLERFSV